MASEQFITELLILSEQKDKKFPIRQFNHRCRGSGYTVTYIEKGSKHRSRMVVKLKSKSEKPLKDVKGTGKQKKPITIFETSKTTYPDPTSAKRGVALYALSCLRDAYTSDLSTRTEGNRVDGEFPLKILRVFKANFLNYVDIKYAEAQAVPGNATQSAAEPYSTAGEYLNSDREMSEPDSDDFEDPEPGTMLLGPTSPPKDE